MLALSVAGVGAFASERLTDPVSGDGVRQPERIALLPAVSSGSSTTLRWEGSTTDYRVVVGADLDRPTRVLLTEVPQVTLTDLPASSSDDGAYAYRVERLSDGEPVDMQTGTFVVSPTVPAKLKAAETTAEAVKLTWRKAGWATTYDISLSTDKADTVEHVRRLDEERTSAVVTGLKADTTYWARVRAVNSEHTGDWSEPVKVTSGSAATTFSLGSWNICAEACSGYKSRVGSMVSQVNAAELDIVALQEAGGTRVGRTTAAAFSGGPQGYVLASGGGESRYLFYRPARFDQLAGGHIALGNGRWATWARFQDKETSQTFIAVSVHLITGKSNAANAKRGRQTTSLLSQLRRINTADDPIVYAGDFNSGTHRSRDTPGSLIRGAGLVDTVTIAESKVNADINTGRSRGTKVIRSADHVDHIFASPEFEVCRWQQYAKTSGNRYVGKFITDHNLITATLVLPNESADLGKATPFTKVPVTEGANDTPVTDGVTER